MEKVKGAAMFVGPTLIILFLGSIIMSWADAGPAWFGLIDGAVILTLVFTLRRMMCRPQTERS